MNRYLIGYDRFCDSVASSLPQRAKDSLGSDYAYMQNELAAKGLSFLDIVILPVDKQGRFI